MEMGKANLRKIIINTEIYMEYPKGKKPRRERFYYNNGDYNGASLVY